MNPTKLDEAFDKFTKNLNSWIPEGIIDVDLEVLTKIGLLQHSLYEEDGEEEELPHYFHVIEKEEKITLFNHQFVVWVVPQMLEDSSSTLVFIALMSSDAAPHLEVVFSTTGVYNTPKLIIRLLRHYLSEVIDTEEAISYINKDK